MNVDRTVHARSGIVEVVRYDRQGKWYAEIDGLPRRPLTLAVAAYYATLPDYEWFPGLPGGSRFDAAVRKRQRSQRADA